MDTCGMTDERSDELGTDGLTGVERADFLLAFRKGVGFKPNHSHTTYVEGCFRCDLTLDEMGVDTGKPRR